MARNLVLASALVLVCSSSLAFAGRRGGGGGGGGRLSHVGGGLRGGSSSSGGSHSSGGSWGRPSSGGSSGYASHGHVGHMGYNPYHSHVRVEGWNDPYAAAPAIGVAGDIYGGVQKLVESDRAFTFDGRLLFAKTVGVAARFTQFRERQDDMSLLKLDLWSMAGTYRIQASSRLDVSPEIGIAGLKFRGDGMPPLTELGMVVGASARLRLAQSTALVGAARYYNMSNAGSAVEGRVGIAVGPLQLSYRAVSFYDAGPPLEGPEVGLGFAF